MARVKLAPFVTSISGSIGGVTIQRNRFGITMRAKPLPILSATSAQLKIRRYISTIQAAWQALSDAQRLQWNRFPDYSSQTINNDRSVKISGHALYLKYQMLRLLAGYELLTTITYIPMPAASVYAGITLAGPTLQFTIIDPVVHTTQFFLFSITIPREENKAPSHKGLRYMYMVPASAAEFQFEDSYTEAFGIVPPLDSWAHYSLQSFSVLAPVYSGIVYGRLIIEA